MKTKQVYFISTYQNILSTYLLVIQIATIDPATHGPRVRSHIFRTFIQSKITPALLLLVSSADVRTPKVTQISANPDIELTWWIDGTQEQFRIIGKANIYSSEKNPRLRKLFEDDTDGRQGIFEALKKEGFDWEAKRREVFGQMSAHMKASWCRPVPGSRLEGGEEEARRWPERVEFKEGDEVIKKNWEMALSNFALVVIDPSVVDFVELGVVPNRRTEFRRTVDGQWEETALVP